MIEAYRTAGSFNGAARILNQAGVVSAFGRTFKPSSVRDIVVRIAPELVPSQPLKGVASIGGFRLSQLLRCAFDGRFLTGSHRRPRLCTDAMVRMAIPRTQPLLLCPKRRSSVGSNWNGPGTSSHKPPRAQRTPLGAILPSNGPDLAERLSIVAENRLDGLITREQARAQRDEIELAVKALRPAPKMANQDLFLAWKVPAEMNRILRSLWTEDTLDLAMRPVAAVWRDEAWRTPDGEEPGLQPPLGIGLDARRRMTLPENLGRPVSSPAPASRIRRHRYRRRDSSRPDQTDLVRRGLAAEPMTLKARGEQPCPPGAVVARRPASPDLMPVAGRSSVAGDLSATFA